METDTINKEKSDIQSNGSAPKYTVVDIESVISGNCSVTNSNIAINGVVARVVVDRCNFDDLLAKKTTSLESENTTRGVKRKLQESKLEEPQLEEPNKSSLELKRKRGRPKKLWKGNPDGSETSSESDTDSGQQKEAKRRGRPKKSEKVVENIKNETELNRLNSSVEKRRFNGGNTSSETGLASTSRVRKPSSRLQDFVISSAVRCYVPSPVSKPTKDVTSLPKEKPLKKINKNEMDDPLSITNSTNENVANKNITTNDNSKTTRTSDDTVRSFLPVFDDSLQSDESDIMEELPNKPKRLIKEKENQVNNLQEKLSKNNSKSLKSDEMDYSPPKLRSGHVTKTKINTPKLQKNITKTLENETVNNNTVVTEQKRLNLDKEADLKVTCDTTTEAETKMNGSNKGEKQSKTNVRYVLVDSDGARNKNKPPKVGDVDFNKLVRSLKLVKLPAANWKIRIVVSKQQTITEVTFTNKEINERCIKFSRTISGYIITFGKSVVHLLGAPTKISSFNDVSILLDIIHHISPNDPVLEYSTSSNP